jgi:hypothetical protein
VSLTLSHPEYPPLRELLLAKIHTHTATIAVIGLALRHAQDKAMSACRWLWRSLSEASP